ANRVAGGQLPTTVVRSIQFTSRDGALPAQRATGTRMQPAAGTFFVHSPPGVRQPAHRLLPGRPSFPGALSCRAGIRAATVRKRGSGWWFHAPITHFVGTRSRLGRSAKHETTG